MWDKVVFNGEGVLRARAVPARALGSIRLDYGTKHRQNCSDYVDELTLRILEGCKTKTQRDVARELGISQPLVSKRLRLLRQATEAASVPKGEPGKTRPLEAPRVPEPTRPEDPPEPAPESPLDTLDPVILAERDREWHERQLVRVRDEAARALAKGNVREYLALVRANAELGEIIQALRPKPPPDPAKDEGIRSAAKALLHDVELTVRALERNELPAEPPPKVDGTLIAGH